jgi:histidine ammonia-lyase
MSPFTRQIYHKARTVIPAITKDRVFATDIENAAAWLRDDWQDVVFNESQPMVEMVI